MAVRKGILPPAVAFIAGSAITIILVISLGYMLADSKLIVQPKFTSHAQVRPSSDKDSFWRTGSTDASQLSLGKCTLVIVTYPTNVIDANVTKMYEAWSFATANVLPVLKQIWSCVHFTFVDPSGSVDGFLTNPNTFRGYYAYHNLRLAVDALSRGREYAGYLMTHDDVLFNATNLKTIDWTRPAYTWKLAVKKDYPPCIIPQRKPWAWAKKKNRLGVPNCVAANQTLTNAMKNSLLPREDNGPLAISGQSDIFYLPQKYLASFLQLEELMFKNRVFLEIAVPTMIRYLVSDQGVPFIDESRLYAEPFGINETSHAIELCTTWSYRLRKNPRLFHHSGCHVTHPVKYSDNETRHWFRETQPRKKNSNTRLHRIRNTHLWV